MSHLARAIPDAVLKRGYVTVGNDLKTIDQNTFVAVNGDAGGTWTPAASLNINGAGVVAAGPWVVAGSQMTMSAPTFGKGTTDDCFGLAAAHAGRSLTLTHPLLDCYSSTPEGVVVDPGYNSTGIFGLITQIAGVRFMSPIRVFGGATLRTVTLGFNINAAHAGLPQTYPQVRIIAIDGQGNVLPLGAGALYDNQGFLAITTVTTLAAYNALGNNSVAYACSQNNVIDLSTYTYWVEVIDESGLNAVPSNGYLSAVSALDSIAIFDGRS